MLSVVTFLWNDPNYRWNAHFRYGPDHVRRLRNMVARNLTLPHEFICVTDAPEAIDPDIRTVPLWDDLRDLPGPRKRFRGKTAGKRKAAGKGCWPRLKAFDRETGLRLGKRFVWLDLDCVVTGSLDPLLSRDEPFIAWRNVHSRVALYCGSMICMDAGARQQVWDEFIADPAAAQQRARQYIGTDQAWISACLGPGEATWTAEDGVYNYRHELSDGALPEDARIVFFTGPVDPSQTEVQERSPWTVNFWR